jgi:hypothetical protein
MRRHHEAASAATVLWVLAGVPAAIAWTQAIVQRFTSEAPPRADKHVAPPR